MAFVFDCASWSSSCMVIAHLATTWMLQNIIPGERRALLSVQMDDFFLGTLNSGGTKPFRARPIDLTRQMRWQTVDLMSKPNTVAGTDIRCVASVVVCCAMGLGWGGDVAQGQQSGG